MSGTAGRVTVIGGGLAGCEAAWQLARQGVAVDLFEMRPLRSTEAHTTDGLAELVCSNSLRDNSLSSAVGVLKEEMRRMGSLIIAAAEAHQVPAGSALAVDRRGFSRYVHEAVEQEPGITLKRGELTTIPDEPVVIVATGPLTSPSLASALGQLMGSKHLYFYDAISPIVTAESVDMDVAFRAARYGRGGDDYVNCPLTEDDYNTLVDEILSAEFVEARDFERCVWFEGCMPVEEIARRGRESLRFGPMKPVGLELPDGGGMAHAVLQLRQDDREGRLLGMVGFQTRMTWTEQRRVFRGIPGLENAEFVRMGSLHRNTFLDSPRVLTTDLQAKNRPGLFIAGQLTGVEGYVESAATGLLCGVNAARALLGQASLLPPPSTALGSLLAYVTDEGRRDFQPMNANYGLMPPLEGRKLRKRERRQAMGRRALEEHGRWMQNWPGGTDGHKERAQQA